MGRKKDSDKVIYYITISDIQEVAFESFERELTPDEIKLIQDLIGDHINWYDAIYNAIDEKVRSGEIVFVPSVDNEDDD